MSGCRPQVYRRLVRGLEHGAAVAIPPLNNETYSVAGCFLGGVAGGLSSIASGIGRIFDSVTGSFGRIINGFTRLFDRTLFFTGTEHAHEKADGQDRKELPHGINDHQYDPSLLLPYRKLTAGMPERSKFA
ncbi:MAG: hypothetical protein ACR2QJ_06105 [Geminicoccaceae bacterium]